ncbi:unnamed protein product [Enterobius vermicularis]|uniref:Uncharacterized protein n=1 Tax=Enterobius vermicularis TaxID=51028 RepID=A0A0N4V0L1_ENTVE|nr:unnamed protein product [Enterobius vermicularis]
MLRQTIVVIFLVLAIQLGQIIEAQQANGDVAGLRVKRQWWPYTPYYYRPMYVRKALVRATPWGPQMVDPSVPL